MLTTKPFKTYNGGKNGSGVYQAIINQIPPHKIFISGFAGNCGVLANKARATMANIAIDLDSKVVGKWACIPGVTAICTDAISFVPNLLACYPTQLAPHIFVFLDPPYLGEVRSCKKDYYRYEMQDHESHLYMLQAMVNLPVNIAITHYPCDLYNNMLHTWRHIDIQGRTRTGMRTERLYMNYPEPTALHDYRYLGSSYRERELYKKSLRNMIAKINRMPPLERNFILSHVNSSTVPPNTTMPAATH